MRTIFKRLKNANLHPAIVRRNSLPDSLWGKMHNLTFYGLFQSWRNNLNVHKEFHTRILSLYVTGWLGSGLNIFTFSAHLSFSVVWLAGPATPQWAYAGCQLATPQWACTGCQLATPQWACAGCQLVTPQWACAGCQLATPQWACAGC